MRIDIWSDVVCPWCYIGKRRLESALSGFEHADAVEIVYHSFQLDPGAPAVPTETVAESLGRKYGGGPEAGQQMVDQVEATAAEEGLLFRLGEAQRASTVDAHRLLHLARSESSATQRALKEELLASYFLRAENPADPEVLVASATSVGLDEARVREVLAGDDYRQAVWDDIDRASDLGATGVPFYVIDDKYAVVGAQPAEVFTQVLEKAWVERQPVLRVVGGGTDGADGADGAGVCGPDGCSV